MASAALTLAARPLAEVQLLKCVSLFLVTRCGLQTGVPQLDSDIGILFAENVSAYGQVGQQAVVKRVQDLVDVFPKSLVAATANAQGQMVRVDYGADMEVLSFTPAPSSIANLVPCTLESVVSAGADSAAPPRPPHLPATSPSGVELLWWATRFLVADLGHDYDSQRRLLSDNATAFGEVGPKSIVAANTDTGVTFGVPYPMTVDDVFQQVVLPFDAFRDGALAYRGTDIYGLASSSVPRGKVDRIITVNHRDGTAYSPGHCVGPRCSSALPVVV